MDIADKLQNKELLSKIKVWCSKAEFVLGVARLEQLPADDRVELAFIGRSNVGKSSIINAICSNSKLAKTSNTPGRTQQLNFFRLQNDAYLVDMPGYGFAKAPEAQVKQWQNVIFRYLQGRVCLKRVFVLIDSRHGIKKSDLEIMEMLDKAAVTYQLILTKIDKISEAQKNMVLKAVKEEISKHAAAYEEIIATSSEKKLGIDEIRLEMFELVKGEN